VPPIEAPPGRKKQKNRATSARIAVFRRHLGRSPDFLLAQPLSPLFPPRSASGSAGRGIDCMPTPIPDTIVPTLLPRDEGEGMIYALGIRFRYLGPVVLITLCLATLCAFTAVSLLNQQEAVGAVLRENVESRRAAVGLERCLSDLIALENNRVERVAVMHDLVGELLRRCRAAADQPQERQLQGQVEDCLAPSPHTR